MRTDETRLIVVSPLARRMDRSAFLSGSQTWRQLTPLCTQAEFAKRLATVRFDIALIDLMWNNFEDEWSFDGLEAIELMRRHGMNQPVIMACQGHGFELDFLEECRYPVDVTERQSLGRSRIKGAILKSHLRDIKTAVNQVVTGREYWDAAIDDVLPPADATIDHWFRVSDRRLALVAGIIAAGHEPSFTNVGNLLGRSPKQVRNKLRSDFRRMLRARNERRRQHPSTVDRPTYPSWAEVVRWCGEHSHYILSWCQRNLDIVVRPGEPIDRSLFDRVDPSPTD